MGLFDALTSAVSGLQAQSFAMQNISGNIANSQTTAYKGVNTSFEDLIPGGGALTNQVAGGVIATCVATNTVQGAIQIDAIGTDMAINGDGYFIVQGPAELTTAIRRFSAGSTAIPGAAISSSMHKAIWSMAPAIISKASRSIRPPAIRPAASVAPCNSRTISCRPIRRR